MPDQSAPQTRSSIVAGMAMAAFFAAISLTLSHESAAQQALPAAASPPAVPVSVAQAKRQDVPIWLRGLGAVQALNNVLLRTRVDGTLMKVAVAEGQEVKQGDLLAVIDSRPYQAILDAASAKKQQDEAQLASAQADLTRYSRLAREEVASRQKLEAVQALVKQITAAIAGDEAQIEAAQLNLGFCHITAPFDGRVGLRTIDPGNFVRAAEATSIVALAQIQPISLTFNVPQDNLPAIQDAMARGRLEVAAYSSDDQTLLDRGALLTVDNAIDATTGTIKLKATFPNASHRLWPGQFVNARLLLRTEPSALVVPTAAVQHGPSNLYVYLVRPDQTVARQEIEISRDDGTLSVITKGLEPGQMVVTNGQSRLQAGSKVAVNEAATGTAGKAKSGG